MATELKFDKDNEDENPTLSTPLGATSGASASGSAPAARPATPSGRPNVQQYLAANQGAGQKLASGIQGEAQKRSDQAGREVDKSRKELDTTGGTLTNELGEGGSQKIKTAFKDPQALLNQQGQLDTNNQLTKDWQKLQSGGYSQDINNLNQTMAQQQANLNNQANQFNQWTQGAATESGRFNLLKDTFGQPNYSRGQQKLDQLFLQAQPGVARTLQQDLANKSTATQGAVNALDADTKAKIEALTGLSSARVDEIKNTLTGGLSADELEAEMAARGFQDIQKSSEQRLLDAQNAAKGLVGIQDRLASPNKLTAADLQALGMGDLLGKSSYGAALNTALKNVNTDPTLAGASDAAEFARYRALQQLAGDNTGDIFGGATAGGDYKALDYDAAAGRSAVDAAKTKYEKTMLQNLLKSAAAPSSGGGFGWTREGEFNALLNNMLKSNSTADQLKAALMNNFNWSAGNNGPSEAAGGGFIQDEALFDKYFADLAAARNKKIGK